MTLNVVYIGAMDEIRILKARVHNLKSVDVNIPRGKLTVITGPSGSGKSSLAFDTLYAEGQRRYIESLSSYARQFLGQMEPPDVESIQGLSPAIAIDQKTTSHNPRSTVGTTTEVYDYLRVLFARIGQAHCPESNDLLESQTPEQIVKRLLELKAKTKIQILAPIVRDQKGEHKELLGKFLSQGFARIRINGELVSLEEGVTLSKTKKNFAEIVVDRIVMKEGIRSRLTDSIEQALKIGKGNCIVLIDDGKCEKEDFFSEALFSPKTGKSYPPLEPRIFSFNSPLGACPKCNGIGERKVFHQNKYVDFSKSLNEGGISPLGALKNFYAQMVKNILEEEGVSFDKPIARWPARIQKTIFEGSSKVYHYSFESENSSFAFSKKFPGLNTWLEKKYHETGSEKKILELEGYMDKETCPDCEGMRLRPFARAVTVNNKSIIEITKLPIDEAFEHFQQLKLSEYEEKIADKLLKEVRSRLKFLNDVGLSYLTLDRSSNSLSGGESQRIRLATQMGSALSGVLYVLDEPSIGLHSRDNDRLIGSLKGLRDLGNTVVVVEHDEETMRESDLIIDIGPGAGVHGGQIVSSYSPKDLKRAKGVTADFLTGKQKVALPKQRRKTSNFMSLSGVTVHNLNDVEVKIPLGVFTCVTGVSGSGKSTLIHKALVPALKNELKMYGPKKLYHKKMQGHESIEQVIEIDQSPIGRTPKSNPATYTKLFDEIRKVFAGTNEAKVRGYKVGRFSFNVKGGRCEHCEGNGQLKIEMNFLPDVYVTCPECEGRRYNAETLNVLYRSKSIADVLEMTIEEAKDFFEHHKKINRALTTLDSIGLGYIRLGQSSTTLSGGEAQRMKLSRELSKSTKGKCLYILDEPTTGLHFKDVDVLVRALNRLVEARHSVLVIEHNLDLIKSADWIIDLGPDGGKFGGEIVASGTPEEIAKSKKSLTGKYLKKVIK